MKVTEISEVVSKLLPAKVRAWAYVIFFIAIAVLSYLGAISEGEAAMWLLLAGNILGFAGNGLALLNKPVPLTTNGKVEQND